MSDPIPAIREHLLRVLQYGGLDKQNLAELVDLLTRYNEKGFVPVKVFPIGIPAVDGIAAHYHLGREEMLSLLTLVAETPRVSEIRVFPKGIPAVTLFQTEVEIR